jgi:hypothetical protein
VLTACTPKTHSCPGGQTLTDSGDSTADATCVADPVDCVESLAATSTCTAVGQQLYTLTTVASGGGTACAGSSTLCVAGDGSIRDCVESNTHLKSRIQNFCSLGNAQT